MWYIEAILVLQFETATTVQDAWSINSTCSEPIDTALKS